MMLRYFLSLMLAVVNTCAPVYASTQRIIAADIIEGQATGKNFLNGNSSHLEKNIGNWLAFADAAASIPVDLTGGSPNTTCTRSATGPLAGEGSMLMTVNSGGSRQGEGCSLAFTIDTKDKYKMLRGKFEYAISSGTYADDEVSVWIFDVSNGVIIQPSQSYVKNHSLPSETHSFEFQATDSTSYRLGIYVRGVTTAGYVLKMDNYHIANSADLGKNYGPVVTDWVSYTPTISFASGSMTSATHAGKWRRVGDEIEISILTTITTAGTFSEVFYSLPSGLSVDQNKLNNSTITGNVKYGVIRDAGFTNYVSVTSYYYSSGDKIQVRYIDTNANQAVITQAAPFSFGSGDTIEANIKLPISGWSSSTIMSSDADTRITAAHYTSATETLPYNTTKTLSYGTKLFDTHGMYDGTTFTAPSPGYYRFTAYYQIGTATPAASGVSLQVSVRNITQAVTKTVDHRFIFTTAGLTNFVAGGSTTLEFKAGETGDVRGYQDIQNTTLATNSANRTFLIIEKLSGPSQIAASETVAAIYSTPATTSIANSTGTYLDYTVKVNDTHGMCTGSGSGHVTTTNTGFKCTFPVAGLYAVEASASLGASTGFDGTTERITFNVYVDGSNVCVISRTVPTSADSNPFVGGSCLIRGLAGQRVEIVYNQNSGGALALGAYAQNRMSIIKAGNY